MSFFGGFVLENVCFGEHISGKTLHIPESLIYIYIDLQVVMRLFCFNQVARYRITFINERRGWSGKHISSIHLSV